MKVEPIKLELIKAPQDEITRSVIKDLSSRADVGFLKYKTTLYNNSHDEFTQHLYEELLDAAQYCKKIITQKQAIQDLIKQYSDDRLLGEIVRATYGAKKSN